MKITKAILTVILLLCSCTMAFPAQTYEFKISSAMSSSFPPQQALVDFTKYLNEKSNGRIHATRYTDGQLGGVLETLEAIQMGVVQMSLPTTSDLAGFDKKIQVLDLPFLFKDYKSMMSALRGPLGKEMDKIFESQGFKCFGYNPKGGRHISNNKRAIYKPEDLKGLKIRVMQNPMHIAIFKALGANPTPLSYSELYTALQQGVVDGQENAPAQVVDANLHEVQKYYSLTGHIQSTTCILVSKKWYDSLPADLQKVFSEGAKRFQKDFTDRYFAYDKQALEVMKKSGVKINTLSDAQLKLFKDKCAPIYKDFRNVVGSDLMDIALAASK